MSTIPECKCGRTCLSKEAYRAENRGRWYWKCALSRCGFFQWNDPGPHVYQPILFTATESSQTSEPIHNKSSEIIPGRRAPSLLNIENINYPLGSKKSRLDSLSRTKRGRAFETQTSDKPKIQLTLYTNTDISIRANARHRYIQTLFRTMKGIVWDNRLHMWLFSADKQMYQRVWHLLHQHRATFEVTGVPFAILRYLPETTEQFYFRHHKEVASTTETTESATTTPTTTLPQENEMELDDDESDLDDQDDGVSGLPITWFQQKVVRGSKLWQSMDRHQWDTIKKGMELDGNIYLHDTSGSGQSLQALGMALAYQDEWPVLIVCRASACQAWKMLIQDMLQLESGDICLLDHVPSYGHKKVYSTSRKAIQSRLYRQRRRELLQQQLQQNQFLSSSTGNLEGGKQQSQQQKPRDYDGGWYVSLANDSGDPWISNTRHIPDFSSTKIEKHNGSLQLELQLKQQLLKQQRQQQKLCITLTNDSGDTFSDDEDMDDGIIGNNTYDSGASSDHTTSSTLVETGINKDEQIYTQEMVATSQFCIISYDKAKTRLAHLTSEKFKLAIFDDCHDIKKNMIPTFRSPLQKFIRGTKKTIMVSSIPIIPSPMKTFPLLQIIKPNLFVDYKYFGHRYCDAKHLVFGWDYTGTSNEFELNYLLKRTLLVP